MPNVKIIINRYFAETGYGGLKNEDGCMCFSDDKTLMELCTSENGGTECGYCLAGYIFYCPTCDYKFISTSSSKIIACPKCNRNCKRKPYEAEGAH